MGRPDLAIQHFRLAVDNDPNILECQYNLVKCLLTCNRTDECLEVIRTALATHKDDIFLMIQLGNIWRLQGKDDEALDHFRMLQEKYEALVRAKRQQRPIEYESQASQPSGVEHDTQIAEDESGDISSKAKQNVVQVKESDHVDDQSPIEYTEEENRNLSTIHHKIGVVCAAQGRLEEAMKEFLSAYQLHSDSIEVLRDLGKLNFQLKNLDEAEKHYRKLLALDPESPEGHTGLGLVMLELARSKTDVALRSFQKALDSQPLDMAQAHFNLASALHKNSLMEEAIAHYEEALKIEPNYVPALNNLGLIWEIRGDINKARENYERAVQISPRDERAQCNLGNIYYRLGRLEEALQCYSSVISLNRENAIVWNYQGLIYTDQKQYDRAIGCFQNALRLRPDLIMVHENVRRLLELQQNDAYCVIS
eukprot:TRINITY_DN5152_c0_g1_i1.p1 TRINITY_DN5152_c0_g1~~TRINITY_DN5152_c0_g1_i1.p1  ORF type:complete len:423 (-),score=95.99 TRINITY_DN5152_c0_g1_i1:350-1618(-)